MDIWRSSDWIGEISLNLSQTLDKETEIRSDNFFYTEWGKKSDKHIHISKS